MSRVAKKDQASRPEGPPLSTDDQREARSVLGRARDVALSLGLGWRIFQPHAGMKCLAPPVRHVQGRYFVLGDLRGDEPKLGTGL
jgi:hypothetical protein